MITTVTLNVSIDKTYWIQDKVNPGTVARVQQCKNTAGGKGLNVARVLNLCGKKVVATGLTGGFNGNYLKALLKEDNIEEQFVDIQGETRCCINILDGEKTSTEFLEPGAIVREEELADFLEVYKRVVENSDVVTISGSVPKGVRKDIYRDLVKIAKQKKKKVILDTSGDLLKEGMKECPDMIKPNIEELEFITGEKFDTLEQLLEVVKHIQKKGIDRVVISLGCHGALLACEEGIFLGKPPKIDVVNTVGCGDSMVAAFAAAYSDKQSIQKSLAYAIAVSAANALSEKTGYFTDGDMQELLKKVEVSRI